MVHEQATLGFHRGAEAYEQGRPEYPSGAIAWLSERLELRCGRTVLDVGAGTGKLTRALVATGAQVLAVEPVAAMRSVLQQAVSGATVLAGAAEALPIADDSIDAVTAASAFHWFDAPAALREFHRVLRTCGRLAVVWNRRRREEPLHRAIDEIIDPYRGRSPSAYGGAWREALEASPLFRGAGELTVPFEQRLDPAGLVDRVASISFVAALRDAERTELLARVRRTAETWPSALVLGYLTEGYVFERTSPSATRTRPAGSGRVALGRATRTDSAKR